MRKLVTFGGAMDKAKSDFWSVRNGVAGAVAILLCDYFRMQLHKWLGIPTPIDGMLGFVLSWTLAWFYGKGFGWTKRAYAFVLVLGAVVMYIVGRLNW